MAYPYTQSVEVTCAQCGKQVKLDIWQIVDADDQPNLLEHQLQVKASAVLSRAVNRPHFGTISA